jgi:hypothetical protein
LRYGEDLRVSRRMERREVLGEDKGRVKEGRSRKEVKWYIRNF